MIHNSHPVQLVHGYLDVIGVGPKISNNSRLNLSHKHAFIKLDSVCPLRGDVIINYSFDFSGFYHIKTNWWKLQVY